MLFVDELSCKEWKSWVIQQPRSFGLATSSASRPCNYFAIVVSTVSEFAEYPGTMSATASGAISVDSIVDQAAAALMEQLKENLHSLILYGSAVRGDLVTTTSDVNFLLVLQASTSASHRAIRAVVQRFPRLNPFIVELKGLPRAVRVFALKFLSIRRDYRLLHGADPLVDLQVPRDLELLLVEQELRNFRMRLVHSYVTSTGPTSRYGRFAVRNASRLIIVLSDVLRCANVTLPHALDERLPVVGREFTVDTHVLRRLLDWKRVQHELTPAESDETHHELVLLCGHVLTWMEQRWPKLPL
jgi:predicted nucleotidyltransferase